MVNKCIYCGQKANKNGKGRTFHKLPLKQPEKLQSWLKKMGFSSDFRLSETMRLCSDHFTDECLRKAGVNVTLVEGSIPTLFAGYKWACAYCKVIKTHDDHRTFHRFPHRNPVLLKKWIASMGLKNYIPTGKSVLCSDHFEKMCFRSSGYGDSLRLRNNVVPSIFAPLKLEGWKKRDLAHEVPAAEQSRIESEPGSPLRSDEEFALRDPSNEKFIPKVEMYEKQSQIDNDSGSLLRSEQEFVFINASNETRTLELRTAPTCNRQERTPDTAQRIRLVQHDHQYGNTPGTTRKRLLLTKDKIRNLREEARIHQQQIVRLKRKIDSIREILMKFGLPLSDEPLEEDDEDDSEY